MTCARLRCTWQEQQDIARNSLAHRAIPRGVPIRLPPGKYEMSWPADGACCAAAACRSASLVACRRSPGCPWPRDRVVGRRLPHRAQVKKRPEGGRQVVATVVAEDELVEVGAEMATREALALSRPRPAPPRPRAPASPRPVLPRYAPSSYYVGSRAAGVASRGLGCPGRAQERRGRTREAPGSARDDSIRPVARTLRVRRRNHRPRRAPVGPRRSPVGLSSQ